MKPDRFPEADLCVIAGDVCDSMHLAVNWVGKVIRPRMPVIWLPGNHEFYDTSIHGGRKNARMIARALDVIMLDDITVEIGSVRYIGGTLWTDFALDGDPQRAMSIAKTSMADYSNIYYGEQIGNTIPRMLKPKDTVGLHQRTVTFIEEELSKPFDGPTVVVSHHAPHSRSIHGRFEGDPCNPAFVSDLSQLIERHGPDVWIHGHVHNCFDYKFSGTRIVCNPRGYGLENEAFEFLKVIEVA